MSKVVFEQLKEQRRNESEYVFFKALSGIVGHSSMTTTLECLIHLNEKHTKKALEVASRYIGI